MSNQHIDYRQAAAEYMRERDALIELLSYAERFPLALTKNEGFTQEVRATLKQYPNAPWRTKEII